MIQKVWNTRGADAITDVEKIKTRENKKELFSGKAKKELKAKTLTLRRKKIKKRREWRIERVRWQRNRVRIENRNKRKARKRHKYKKNSGYPKRNNEEMNEARNKRRK